MKILQVTPRIPSPPNDGGAVYIYYTTKYLSLLGEDVQIVSFISNKHAQEPELLDPYSEIFAVDGKFKPYNFFAALKSLLTLKPITIQHRMKPSLMQEALNKVTISPDIILLEGLHTAAFTHLVKEKFPSVPIILRQSNVEYLLLKRNAETSANPAIKLFYYLQSQFMKRFEIKSMSNVDAVTAITPFDKDIYLQNIPDLNCFVSPAGTEIPTALEVKRNSAQLLAISNWRWKPNIDGLRWFFKEVWPELKQRHQNISIDVAGEGLTEKFKSTFDSPGINYLGFVDDLEPLRQSATVFVAPLFSGSGMKLKIVEGLASGLPIVTTAIGAEGIDIRNGVHYLEGNSIDQFIEHITSLLENEDLRDRLSGNARKIAVDKYDWESVTKRLIQFLKSIKRSG
ncbi:glycosyltransferase family 4 protein [Gracilimonas sp.]|uniref:glycosyltransferase family 4 protein n=1 Tax=Gracilimonas sp. TaxID=1974203 RepID=UPI003D134A11